ncbi:hypothetical protein [Mesorhizobium sp. M0977]|uniref:hypothetical protein n=1 Tax=Mesorhizobium sp. M0977 TaxID=2957039 RepID=UPI00333BEFA8
MIDLPDRRQQRFPADRERAAAAWIQKKVEIGSRGTSAAGFSSGSRGGDILFLEACMRVHIETHIVLPFEPELFVQTSVSGVPTGNWERRFWDVWTATLQQHREVLGLTVSGKAYQACNARLLDLARQHGRVHLICLWDGKEEGDGPGGTADLVRRTERLGDIADTVAPLDLDV